MSGYLLDTNCLSELVRLKPEPRVAAWIEAVDESVLYLSVLTFGEIRKRLAALPQSKRRANLETWLEVELRARFAGRVLPIDITVADRWGLLAAQTKAKGKPLSIIDGLLAATALHYNLTFVTRNINDVIATGVATLDPWASQAAARVAPVASTSGFLRLPYQGLIDLYLLDSAKKHKKLAMKCVAQQRRDKPFLMREGTPWNAAAVRDVFAEPSKQALTG